MSRWNYTHTALQQAALELFAEQGYAATSTAAIAKRAGVTEMTLFRHFPTKAALVLADPFDPVIADAVRSRPLSESPVQALVAAVRASWGQLPPEAVAELQLRLGILVEAGIVPENQETIAALTAVLIERGTTPAAAQVASTAVIAGLTAALLDWAAKSEPSALDDAISLALDTLVGQ